MALSSSKSTSTGTRLPFISCKPRMRVILPSQFQPFKFSDDDLAKYDSDYELHFDDDDDDDGFPDNQIGDDHMDNNHVDDDDDFDQLVDDSDIITEIDVGNDYAEVYIQLDQPSSSNEQFTDIDEDEIAMEEIIVPDPDDDDDENDYDNPNIIVQDDISEKEESTGSNNFIIISPPLRRKPRMRVMSPSKFKTFGFTITEADDILVDEADFDDDHFDDESETMDVDEDFQEDHIIVSDDDDYDGVDDDGYLSDSSLRSTATQLPKSRLKSRSLVIRIL